MCVNFFFPHILLIFQLSEHLSGKFSLENLDKCLRKWFSLKSSELFNCPGKILWPNGEQQTITIPSSWQVLKSPISCLSISKLIGRTPIIDFFIFEQIVLMHWLFLQKEDFDWFDGDELFIINLENSLSIPFSDPLIILKLIEPEEKQKEVHSALLGYLNNLHKRPNIDKNSFN